jgi:hypothetical protein
MNNHKIRTILLILISLISCTTEERTPQSITKALIGLEINKDVSVIEFKDQWGSMTGDGMSFIVFKLNTNQIQSLKDRCRAKEFKALPIKESLPDGYINHYLNPFDTIGYYWLDVDKKDYRNYCIVILCEVSKRLIVYNVIN